MGTLNVTQTHWLPAVIMMDLLYLVSLNRSVQMKSDLQGPPALWLFILRLQNTTVLAVGKRKANCGLDCGQEEGASWRRLQAHGAKLRNLKPDLMELKKYEK